MAYERFKRRRRFVRRGGSKLTKRQKQEVKAIVYKNLELKHVQEGFIGADVVSAGTITQVSVIPLGPGKSQRIGDEISLKGFEFRFEIELGSGLVTSHDEWNNVRLIVFRWRDSNYDPSLGINIGPGISDILDPVGANPVWLSNYNYENKHRYTILYDKVHTVWSTPVYTGTVSTYTAEHGPYSTKTRHINLGKKVKAKIYYDDDSSMIHGSNQLYVLFASDSNYASHPKLSFVGTLSYTDA